MRPKTTFLAQLQREKKLFFSVNEGEETGGTVEKVAGSSTVDEEEGGRKMRCGQENSHVFGGRESVGGGPVSLVTGRTKKTKGHRTNNFLSSPMERNPLPCFFCPFILVSSVKKIPFPPPFGKMRGVEVETLSFLSMRCQYSDRNNITVLRIPPFFLRTQSSPRFYRSGFPGRQTQ